MARLHVVKASRESKKGLPVCGRCRTQVPVGTGYKYWETRSPGSRRGVRHVRCLKPECHPKGSELEGNPFRSALMALEERTSDALTAFRDGGDVDELTAELESIGEECRTLGEEQNEKRSNMPEQLQDSETGEMLGTRAEELETLAGAIDDAAQAAKNRWDEEEFDPEGQDEDALKEWNSAGCGDTVDQEEDEDEEAFVERIREAAEPWNEHLRGLIADDVEGEADFSAVS